MKLPHWAIVACSLGVVVIAWIMKANAAGDFTLPAAAVTGLVIVNGLLGTLSGSALGGGDKP